jgi:leader peptidase (prepilin peptidase)/N-methyltransferase
MLLVSFLQQHPLFFYFIAVITGLVVGSFLNVVILRLPRMMEREFRRECHQLLEIEEPPAEEEQNFNLNTPASHCPSCGHGITALENIPLLSYLFLRGKCSACGARISLRYPVIEAFSGAVTLLVAMHFGVSPQALLAALLSWALIALGTIDLETQLLPDDITLPFLWLGILANMYGVFTGVYSSLFGVMAGYLSLWAVYKAFKLLTGKEGMGYGDFKLLAMLGAWLGWQMLPLIVILSSAVGAVVGIGLILFRGHARAEPIPFGPYLAAAGWLALLYGDTMMSAYLHWAMPHGL